MKEEDLSRQSEQNLGRGLQWGTREKEMAWWQLREQTGEGTATAGKTCSFPWEYESGAKGLKLMERHNQTRGLKATTLERLHIG